MRPVVRIVHHPDCPLGENGLRAYWEARDALSSLPPEALATNEDRIAAAVAAHELEEHQECTCGVVRFGYAEVHLE